MLPVSYKQDLEQIGRDWVRGQYNETFINVNSEG